MAQNMYEYILNQDIKSMAKFLDVISNTDFIECDFCGRVCPFRDNCEDFECKISDDGLNLFEMWLGGEVHAKECCEVNQDDK